MWPNDIVAEYNGQAGKDGTTLAPPDGESYLAEQFRQITHYLEEQFRQITHYLAEQFRQITHYLEEQFRQIAHYLAEHLI